MSWWVKEISTITEDQSERLCIIETDTPNDLPNPVRTKPDPDNPGQTITDYTIVRGSEAYCLSNSKFYKLNSQGQWVEQTSGGGGGGGASSADQVSYDNTSSGMTATNVQDAIDELHTTDDTQDRALAELHGEDANQQLEINYAINTGAKNLFPITAVSQTIGGVTFTVNDDGTITANGTKTNNDWFTLSENNSFDAGTYTLSDGLPDDITGCMLIISTARSMGAAIMGTETNRRTHTKTFTTAQNGLYYAIRISSGTTVNNLTFKPMLRVAEIRDTTFEPYAPTNRELYETMQKQALRYEDSSIIRLNQLSWSQTSSGTGMWIADCYTTQTIDTIVSVIITSFSALKPSEIKTLFTYIPSSVSGMHTVRLICDRDLTGLSSNPTLYLRVFGYGYQTASSRMLSFNSPMKLNLNRNDLNESLDTNFDLLDSIPEEEEGEEDV